MNIANYPLRIYAVYIGVNHAVKVDEYPARYSKLKIGCIECALYLSKTNIVKNGMVKLPSNEFYKNDFEKSILLHNCTVMFFLDKKKAQKYAQSQIITQYKLMQNDIALMQNQIESMQEKISILQSIQTNFENGKYTEKPSLITDNKSIAARKIF